jgi:GNAT superfamily N-acetyltransferase
MTPLEAVARIGSLVLVPGGVDVLGYVVASWCKSSAPAACEAVGLPHPDELPPDAKRLVHAGLYARVKTLLARASMRALIAVAEVDPSKFLGYVVYEETHAGLVLHYLYVDKPVRRHGLAGALLDAAGFKRGGTYTHHTPAGLALVRRYGLTYQPEPHPCPTRLSPTK